MQRPDISAVSSRIFSAAHSLISVLAFFSSPSPEFFVSLFLSYFLLMHLNDRERQQCLQRLKRTLLFDLKKMRIFA